mgnify:CR=1 FL=1
MQHNSKMRLRTLCKGVHVLMRLLDVYSRCKAEDRRMKNSLRRKTDAVINKTTEFMFAGIKMSMSRLRLILARAVRRGLK